MVSLKRLEPEGLVFTTALWTRKAAELRANPRVALVFHWPAIATRCESRVGRRSASGSWPRNFSPSGHAATSYKLQALVSRQGETIEDLGPLRTRLDALKAETAEDPIPCPPDWSAVRVRPGVIEFWSEGEDRLHERRLFQRNGDSWAVTLLAP